MIACEHNLFEEDGQAVSNVLSLTVHENYGPFGFENDICLVEHDNVAGLECAWGPIQTVTMPSQGQDWEAVATPACPAGAPSPPEDPLLTPSTPSMFLLYLTMTARMPTETTWTDPP